MTLSEAGRILQHCPLFSSLDEAALARLGDVSLVRSFRKGQTLFREGDAAEGFYIVGTGAVKVFKRSSAGREHILHDFRPGDLVAEAAVFDTGTFPAHAEAMEESRVLLLYKKDFLRILRESPELVFGVLSGLTRRLREFATLIEDLSLKDVAARLARYILGRAEEAGGRRVCRLDISKSQLAARLGTVNETLSRTLRKMKLGGLIAETDAGIIVLDAERLGGLVDGAIE